MFLEKGAARSEFDEAVRRATITLAAELLTYSYADAHKSIEGAQALIEGGDFAALPAEVRRLGAAFAAHLPQEHPAAASKLLRALTVFIRYAETGRVDLRGISQMACGYILDEPNGVEAVRVAPLRVVS